MADHSPSNNQREMDASAPSTLFKPMDLKKLARVPYSTVIGWLTTGHPRAGILPSIDLAAPGKRHSFRIRRTDWEAFLARLQTVPKERQQTRPLQRPSTLKDNKPGLFRY